MSTAVRVADGELELPEPIGLQPHWLASRSSKKVLRVGRRGTKTRFAFFAALMGHGPGWEDDTPLFPGVLQGGDVIWFAQTYTNLSTVLWHEEIVPRMGHLPWIVLNETKHDVTIPGVGALMLRSADAEAIKSVRGAGKRLKGVIIDEAAWLALRAALLDIILPALLDNDGWLILMSTTNAGPDGGYDDQGAPQVPSYFNVICEEIRAGKRSEDWEEFTGTAFDNPTLNPAAIRALIAEYPPESPKLEQEVYAKLLKAGVGLALPKVCKERHIVERFRVPSHWTQFGAFDWGFAHPWVFGWYAVDEDGTVFKVDTLSDRQQLPDQIADAIIAGCPAALGKRFNIHAGHDVDQRKGRAVGFKGPTISEKMQVKGLKVLLADNRRVAGLDNLRAYVHWEETWPPERTPRFLMMDTPGNLMTLATLQRMQKDPDDHEDALKIDADAAGRGGDDAYDETRYALMSRPIDAKAVNEDDGERQGVSVGYDYEVAKPRTRESAEDLMAKLIKRAQPHVTAGRYSVPRRR